MLHLGRAADSPEQVDWSALLPAEDETGRLIPDPNGKTLTIDPPNAVVD